MKNKNIRKRSIGTLVVLLIVLSFSITPALMFTDLNIGPGPKKFTDEEQELNLSTNYLFKGTSYVFNLDNFFDDANLYKIWTGAKFQTEAFNQTLLAWSGDINNDTVTPVDNDETQYGTPSGDYNGTYTFTDIPDGTEGLDIDFVDEYGVIYGTNSYAKITAELDGHKKILEIYDYDNTELVYIQNNFENQVSGTIEFWHYAEDNGVLAYYIRQGSTSAIRGYIRHSGATIKAYNETVMETIVSGDTNNIWHHIRFDYNCTSDKFDVYYDGVKVADQFLFTNVVDSINNIHFTTTGLYTVDTSKYLDAIGYKTDNYTATESFDYTTEEGVYYGTYDFRDELGETDYDIDWIDSIGADDTGNLAEVIASEDGHKNVAKFITDGNNGKYAYWKQNNDDQTADGTTFEFWLKYIDNGQGGHMFYIGGIVRSTIVFFGFSSTSNVFTWYYGNGAGGYTSSNTPASADTWHHVKISFDFTADTYDIYLNGVLKGDDKPYYNDLTDTGLSNYRIQMDGFGGVNSGEVYMDAVGESWDTTSHGGIGYDATKLWNVNSYDILPFLQSSDFSNTAFFCGHNSYNRITNFESHQNVMEMYDNYNGGYLRFKRYFGSGASTGTVEFWVAKTGTYTLHMYIDSIKLLFFDDKFGYYNSTQEYNWVKTGVDYNRWYHIKVVFDCGTDTFDYYIDNELLAEDCQFRTPDTSITYMEMITWTSAYDDSVYLDAVGYYPWDPNYNVGDNLEGWDKDYTIGENLYPDNINMVEGSYDYTDNMKINDASYTTFTSTHTDGYVHEMPHQWDNFTFTNGTGITIGELETIDADYSVIRDDYLSDSSDVWCIPDDDTSPNDWNDGVPTPHWDDLDEDPFSPDGYSMTESTASDQIDEFSVTNGDIEGGTVYQVSVLVNYMGMGTTGYDAYVELYFDGAWKGYKKMARLTTQYYDWTVSGDQDNVDNIQVRFKSYLDGAIKSNIVMAFRVKVYYSSLEIDLDVQIDMQVDDPDCSSIEYLKYSHKTNVSATIDLDIWNWDSSTWYEIESVDNSATFDDDSFTLGSSSNYVNSTNGVRIRFQLNTGTNDFELQIDRLRLDYLTTPAELEMIIMFSFANYNEDLLAMNVQSWQKTNISQTITFKIWNYDTDTWVQISSSSDTSFTKKEYNTESPTDFISPTGVVKLNWTGSNTTNNFELHIDYLFIQIFYKLDLVHSKSFDTNGIYRYRWVVLGSIHYTQWVTFEVVDPVPNFHAISESDVATRWILQGSDISAVENFTDDISGSNWNLYGVSENSLLYKNQPSEDVHSHSGFPTENWDYTDLMLGQQAGTHYLFFGKPTTIPYFTDNLTANVSISLLPFTADKTEVVEVYSTSEFVETTLTWNNQPAPIDHIHDPVFVSRILVRSYIDLGDTIYDYYRIDYDGAGYFYFYRKERGGEDKDPFFYYYFSKKYQSGGYMYMQTNITELISLKSTVYGTNYTLSSGDYFEVDFQTSSDSQINLILLKEGVVNKTLTLSQSGNPNFNRHTVKISVDEIVEFDQLKISSTFEDLDNVKVYDIKTKKYTITGDSADFRVGSHQDHSVYLTPDTYNLGISEGTYDKVEDEWSWSEKYNKNITISSTDYYHIYQPIEIIQCRLTLFSPEGDYLNFVDYHIKLNRSLSGQFNQFWLVDTIFYADIETYTYIEIYDRFDTLIDSFERLASSYIDLEIEVYSLQIKNLQTQKTTVDINATHVYPLLSEESLYFMLAKDYYQIGYYDTNNVYKQFLIYLDSNQAYELNRSKICFLAYVNQKGEHLYFNDYKTYINDSLIYENIFYREIRDDIGIEVKDLYGISIKNQSYTVVSGDNYIPIVLTMYSLKVMNQQEQFNHINITRDPNYYESGYYWSEWIAPNEIVKFRLFPGYYKINLTDNEGGSYSFYEYTLNGDDILLISSDNILSQVIYNIANVNTTIGNQITNVEINITNQNSQINNTIVNIEINLSNVNSTLGNLLTNIDLDIINLQSDINSLYTFTNTSIWNLNNAMNSSFIYMENNIYSINQSISTLVIGIDNSISLVNATITSMFTEMSNQFIVVQSTLNYSFAFLNQTIIQLANNITENHVILYNLIEQRANDIDSSLIDVQTLINLVNNTVADESLVIQTLVNLIGANITNNHIIINNFLNLIDNNITNNNIQLVSILEVIGNNITTNHFVIQTLLDVIGNNITYNHIEMLTNLNLINTTISQNQIELINRLLFINNTVNDLMFELTNQLLFLNGTIYSAVLNLSTSVEFGVDMVIGNITITYQQNEFLTELYKQTMFSQLLNWSGVAYNYTLMEDRIDVWDFINNYKNQSIEIHLRYGDLIDNLTVSAQNNLLQYLPKTGAEYREWSVAKGEYLSDWKPLPDNKTVSFGFFEEEVPFDPEPIANSINNVIILLIFGVGVFLIIVGIILYLKKKNRELQERDKYFDHKLKPTSFSRSITD